MSMGTECGAIILQWPLAQLFPAAWAGSMGQCSVYLSEMSIGTECGTIILQWPLAQLFPAAWAGSTGQCSVYLS